MAASDARVNGRRPDGHGARRGGSSDRGGDEHGFPWLHIIGYVASIGLTITALWLVLNKVLGTTALLVTILALACSQIVVQLFFFMHVTESRGPRYHLSMLTLAVFFAFAVIAGSIWIMTFGDTQAY